MIRERDSMPWQEIDLMEIFREFNLKKAPEALKCAGEYFEGVPRKDGRDSLVHSIRVTQILAFHILRAGEALDDDLMSASPLHDVLEDISWEALDDIIRSFGDDVGLIVWLMSREEGADTKFYFSKIGEYKKATLLKIADRLHNLRNMTKNLGLFPFFTKERLQDQVNETKKFVFLLAKKAMKAYPECKEIIEDMFEELLYSVRDAEIALGYHI